MESTIENRVYLYKDMASAWLAQSGDLLVRDRGAALKALADIAFVACTLADEDEMDPAEVAAAIEARGA
ncbi:MAG: hypothetical protein AAF645_02395 [Myxococcota bacterium]